MSVILSDRSYAKETSKLTGLFVSIYGRWFKISDRHITIRKLIVRKNLHMMRTIHRLEKKLFISSFHFKKIITVFVDMS